MHDDSISWKLEDLREQDTATLFHRLYEFDLYFDKMAFISYAEQFDSPEELMEHLLTGEAREIDESNKIYLIVFELWRRLLPENICLSVFADALDWKIFDYEERPDENQAAIEDGLEDLHNILEENVDQGIPHQEVFSAICEFFACDLERFLYDFISTQLDKNDFSYATELIDHFTPFVIDAKWFHLLRARIIAQDNLPQANALIRFVFEQSKSDPELILNLDILDTMLHVGDHNLFLEVCDHTLSLIDDEVDFLELLETASDYFRCLDQDDIQEKIDTLIYKRRHTKNLCHFSKQDTDIEVLRQILALSTIEQGGS